jgi:hypothetical protein
MGNKHSLFVSNPPEPGKLAVIKDNEFTREWEFPNDVLRRGQLVKVIKSGRLLKSRPGAPDISISTIMFRDGSIDAIFSSNLDVKK